MVNHITRSQLFLLVFNILLACGFGIYFASSLNWEFVAYAGSILGLTLLLFATLSFTRFPTYILAGISIWAVLHMLGGTLPTPDGVLYAYKIYPFFDGGGDFYILKMDQVIHAFLYGVVGLMMWHIMREVVEVRTHTWLVAGMAIFAAAGISIVNEIVEFWAAVNIPDNGVGGYHNTVLDMIFNLSGAAVAVTMAVLFRKK